MKKDFSKLTKLSMVIAVVAVPAFGMFAFSVLGGSTIGKLLQRPDSIDSGLVGHWTFDGKDMVSNVADVSGNGNHGSLLGQTSTTTTAGKVGQALEFDGSDDYVKVSDMGSPQQFTFSFWIDPYELNIDAGNNYRRIIDAATSNNFILIEQGGSVSFRVPGVNTNNYTAGSTGA